VVAVSFNEFRRVLGWHDGAGRAGALFPVGDPVALAEALRGMLVSPRRRESYIAAARQRVTAFDWTVLSGQVLRVYEQAVAADPRRIVESDAGVESG